MNTNDIIEIAGEAGATIRHTAGLFELSDYRATHFGFSQEALTKFAELIQARAVPDGYVVVPVEPTALMIDAAVETFGGVAGSPENLAKPEYVKRMVDRQIRAVTGHYQAMIAAAQKGSV